MFRVGLTGGAGSGKSTVAGFLADLGFPVLDADRVAHELYVPGSALALAVGRTFGPGVLRSDGSVDRAVLGRIVFGDPDRRAALNALVHPPLVVELDRRLDLLEAKGDPVAVLEAALLLQWSAPALVDLVVGVWAPREVRLARLVAGGLDARAAGLRVDAQIADSELRRKSDLLVENTAGVEALRAAVGRLAADLRRRAATP